MTAHKHAAILAQAAEDAKTDPKFYAKWERKYPHWSEWYACDEMHFPGSDPHCLYRRKPAKPRECLVGWNQERADAKQDPWGSAFPIESNPPTIKYTRLRMIEVTPEVRAALAAAGIEVSQ